MNMNLPSGGTLLLLRCKERGEEREREREKGGNEKVAVIDFMFDERVSLFE